MNTKIFVENALLKNKQKSITMKCMMEEKAKQKDQL